MKLRRLAGIGPIYGTLIVTPTVVLLLLHHNDMLPSIELPARLLWQILGWALVVGGLILWVGAVFFSKLNTRLLAGQLMTDGAFAWVRHPIYVAFLLACTGLLLTAANAWLLLAPVCFWVLLVVLVTYTEEKWCLERFGQEYRDYCSQVNRTIPWPPGWRSHR